MPWLTIAYSMTAAACVTLALVHLVIWFKQPERRAHLAFSMTAISVAAITPFELLMARAQTVGQFGSAVRWAHVPVALVVFSVVWFLRLHFRTGRLWLAYAVCGLRVLALILNFSFTPNLNYREITGLRQVALFGGESASVAVGVVNPWTLIGQLSLLLLLVYVVDASFTLWRKGNRDSRRRALIVGGGMVFFILGSASHFALVLTGLIVSPLFLSFPFLAIVVAMGYELSLDVVRAGQLSLEVQANEQRLSLAQEAGDIGTFDWDIRTGEVRWTEKLESIYGLPAGGFGGTFDSWRERVHPEDLPRCEAEINETIRQKISSWRTEYRMFRADSGEMRWIDARGRFFFDARRAPVRMLGVNVDITARKVTEAVVREKQAQLAGIISSAMDAIISVDENQDVVLFNAAAEKMFSCSAREAIGQSLARFIPDRFLPAHKDHVRAFRKTNESMRAMGSLMPIFGRRATGEDFPIEASISHVELNGQNFYTVILRDITRRSRAESSLRESEERFAKAFRANPQPMSLTTLAEGRYVDVNESFLTTSGYRREEVIGRNSIELGIWETPVTRAEFMQRLTEHGVRNVETHFGTKGGSFRILLTSAELVKIGGEQCVLVASSDITDRKQVEEALRESEQRFRNMADTAPVMIWISGPDKLCTYFNKQWLDFTGRSMEQELGSGWAEGVYKDDYDRCLEIYNSAFDRREPFRMEYRLRRADGKFRWLYDSGTPRLSSDGEFLGYIGSCIDIADRKEAEDAVRAAKDELRLIADALPVLISEVDKNGYYRFNNLAYEKWFGQPSDQITGHHMREVLGEVVWERIRPQVEKTLAGQEVHYEDFLSYRDGGPRWVSVTGIPTRDAAGELNGFVSLVADITESRRAEEVLRDLSGRLINAQEEERSRVARELHDDLSQRIAVLSIGLEQIGQQIPQGPNSLHGRLQSLWTEAQEISTELHRVSYQLHPSKLDHLGLVAAVRSFCEELAARHEINIRFRQTGFPAPLPKDITLCLFRIVQESLHNAVKHSGAREAQVVLEKTDQAVRLSVSDSGCGFDTESNKMTSGLGFISMRERLRLVGGQLSICSRPFQGTTIEVSVPLMKQDKRSSSESSSQTKDWSTERDAIDENSQTLGVE